MFYSIDIVKDLRYCPEHMFNDPSMHFLFGDVCSYKIINQLPQQIDFLFTDTMHFYFQLRDEWDVYQHLLSDTALVAIDDINIHDKRKLFDEVNYTKWDLTELCHANGWGLFLFQRKNPVDTLMQKSAVNEALIHIWERKYESLFDQVKSNREQSLPFKIKQ